EDEFPAPEHPHTGGTAIYLPQSTAAEAVCAAVDVPLAAILADARMRVVRLELARLGRLLAHFADVTPAVLYTALPTLRERFAAIDALVARYGPPLHPGPEPPGSAASDEEPAPDRPDDDRTVTVRIWSEEGAADGGIHTDWDRDGLGAHGPAGRR